MTDTVPLDPTIHGFSLVTTGSISPAARESGNEAAALVTSSPAIANRKVIVATARG